MYVYLLILGFFCKNFKIKYVDSILIFRVVQSCGLIQDYFVFEGGKCQSRAQFYSYVTKSIK